jgi:hypothetical protein
MSGCGAEMIEMPTKTLFQPTRRKILGGMCCAQCGGPFCKMSSNGCTVQYVEGYDEPTVPICNTFPKILTKTDNMVNILI